MSLAASLRGIVSQRLVEKRNGGRVPAVEVLVATGRVFDKIVSPEETHEIEDIIAEGEYYGMQTFDQSLLGLYKQGSGGAAGGACGLDDAPRPAAHDRAAHDGRGCAGSSRRVAERQPARSREGSRRVNRGGTRADHQNGRLMTAVPPRSTRFFEPDSPTQQLAGRLAERGHRAYLVGGSVRDALLDRDTSDVDVTTDARPDVIEGAVSRWADAVWLQGKRFGTIGCEKDGERFEITTFRAEVYHPDSRKPEVSFGDDIETDLSRRDFTVNAMAIVLDEPELADPFDGLADLAAHRLRTPLAPEVSFDDDPLRMLRAVRFVASLGFEPDAVMVQAIEAMHDRLEIVERGAHPRRAVEAVDRARPESGTVAHGAHAPLRRVLARAERDAARTRPDSPAQRRVGAHHRGRRQDVTDAEAAPRRAAPRRRQAAHARLRTAGCDVPSSRSRRRAHGARAIGRVAISERDGGGRDEARRAPPAVPHVPDGVDRFRRAPLRARRGRSARRSQRAHPLRLHDARRTQGRRARAAHGRARGRASPSFASKRSWRRSARRSTAVR